MTIMENYEEDFIPVTGGVLENSNRLRDLVVPNEQPITDSDLYLTRLVMLHGDALGLKLSDIADSDIESKNILLKKIIDLLGIKPLR